ncbi:hypothetical protein GGI35DRAFT_452845 [Trichoderma velutinum]
MHGAEAKSPRVPSRTMAWTLLLFPLSVTPKCVHACTYRQTVIRWCVRDCVCEYGHGGLCQLRGHLPCCLFGHSYMHESDVESAYESGAAVNQDTEQDLVCLSLFICLSAPYLCLYPLHLSLSYLVDPNDGQSKTPQFVGGVPEKQTATYGSQFN